jgi:Cu2+-exporting ATPase
MTDCTLCDLPTPDPPITDEDVDGVYCCRGCLEVARTLDDAAGTDADDVREELAAGGDADDVPGDAAEAFLAVDGMHCATCEAFVESRAAADEGVYRAEASYPSNAVKLTYDPGAISEDDLASLIDGLGYSARDPDEEGRDESESVGRLLVGGFFGMMTMLWYVLFLYPAYLGVPAEDLLLDVGGSAGQYLVLNVWVMATVVLGYTGYPILRGAYVSLRAGYPNMDLLVAVAATTAYLYSAVAAALGHAEVYFDITVVVVMAVTVGNYYEGRLTRRAAGELGDVVESRVDAARRRTDDGEETVAVEDVDPGDQLVVRAGERVPLDGVVVDGTASVDESLMTGESLPVRKEPGDEVVGGAAVSEGGLVVAVGDDAESTVDRLLRLQWDIRSTRPGAQKLADRIAAVFVPLVFALAAVAFAWHLLGGTPPAGALLTALAVLVVSCPCALGLATPLAVASGVRAALRRGIVVAEGSVFERATEAGVVAFDKTGTLTTGEMRLLDREGGDEVLRRAAAVERFSDHPIAAAITGAAGDDATGSDTAGDGAVGVDADDADADEGGADDADAACADAARSDGGEGDAALASPSVADFETHPGRGVSALVDGERVVVGREALFEERAWRVPDRLRRRAEEARETGRVPALVGWDGAVRGLLVAGDRPRENWEEVVSELATERRVVVITGDGEAAAAPFEAHPGVDEVLANVRPEAKAAVVERLRREGTTAMVGDGSNDAPALAAADLGIALERGTRLAADAADVVVTGDDLRAVPRVFDLTAATRRRIRQNLGWAFVYNAVAVPLAVAGLLNPLFAAVAMATSSLLVVGNSSRSLLGGDGDRGGTED